MTTAKAFSQLNAGSKNRHRAARSLEAFLGNPANPENVFSFKRAVELDELEQLPQRESDLLSEWGLHHYYVPARLGGRLSSFDEVVSLIRAVARRDLAVAVSHATTCAAGVAAWVAGDDQQQRRMADLIGNGERVALTYHEREHGNDLLSCEVEAIGTPLGFRLSGEKWVVGNARWSGTIVVFARTKASGGARGFSLLLVEKRRLDDATYSYLPRFKTHGVRSHEISGIRFQGSLLDSTSMLGPAGSGLEAVLKCAQVTRIIPAAMCLGAADTALRLTFDFALSRRLYGNTVFAIPHSRSLLIDSFLDLLTCECVELGAARALHAAPDQMSLRAAAAKYFIVTVLAQTLRNLSVVLGARHYLREGHWWGVFQKIVRDFALTGVGHYSSVINLSHLAPQLQTLAGNRKKTGAVERDAAALRLRKVFGLDEELPQFDASALSLHNRGRDDVVDGLETAMSELRSLSREEAASREVIESILDMCGRLNRHLEVQECVLSRRRAGSEELAGNGAEMFEMARRYSRVHAGAACVQMWLNNRKTLGEFFERGEWLAMSLERLVKSFEPDRGLRLRKYEEQVAHELTRLYRENRLFSIIPWRLPH